MRSNRRSAVQEVHPGIVHWTRVHPGIKIEVSSYYLPDERVLIDPLVPDEGWDALSTSPEHVLLTNRHHYRDSGSFAQRFGCTVWCVESGLHEFTDVQPVRPFRFGDRLPGGILAVEVGALCPDETALHIPKGGGLFALADGVVRQQDGPLRFVPDAYLGRDPEGVKSALRRSYARLLEHPFDHLTLAHGWPWIGGGKQALRAFVEADQPPTTPA
jgi:hypothetical protein